MSVLTATFYDVLAGDGPLASLVGSYKGHPAVFTIDPVPGDATLPYIVSAGEVVQLPWDTKQCRGREVIRDIRVYDEASGDTIPVEAMAERVRELFHRREITIQGYTWVISNVTGPIVADGDGYYGRVISVTVKAQET